MKNYFSAILLITSIFFYNQASAQQCNVTSVIYAGIDTVRFNYDADNHVQWGPNVTTNSSGLIIDMSKPERKQKAKFIYDTKNNLVEYQMQNDTDDAPGLVIKYTYNASNQLTEIKSINKVQKSKFYGYNVFSYLNASSKNPVTVKYYLGDSLKRKDTPYQTNTYSYDNKKVVPSFVPDVWQSGSPFATSNVTSETITRPNNAPEKKTYSYQYNAQGYPTSKTYKSGETVYTDSYNYQCK
jgi:YD repeat-containing protein